MKHKGCGGTLYEDYDRGKYVYCSTHDNECDAENCADSMVIPALICDRCDEEIGGDAMIEGIDGQDPVS